MQILLQALFAETEGKRPVIAEGGEKANQDLFADLFSSQADLVPIFDGVLAIDDLPIPPVPGDELSKAELSTKVEVFLPELGQQGDRSSGRPMIDITPEDTARNPELSAAADESIKVPAPTALQIAKSNPIPGNTQHSPKLPQPVPPDAAVVASENLKISPSENSLVPRPAALDVRTEKATEVQVDLRMVPISKPAIAPKAMSGSEAVPLPTPREVAARTPQPSRAGELSIDPVVIPRPSQTATVVAPSHHPVVELESQRIERRATAEDILKPKIQSHSPPATMVAQSTNVSTPKVLTPTFDVKATREQAVSLDPIPGLTPREAEESRPQTPAATRAEAAVARPVVNQVIQMVMRANLDSMIEVRLQPEELGRVRLAITQIDSGMAVHITAERPETLDLLRRNIDMLGSDLRDQGFESASFTFGQDSEGKNQRNREQVSGGTETTPQLQVDIITEPLLSDDGRLDIRL